MLFDERLFERIQDALARKEGVTDRVKLGAHMCVVNGHDFVGATNDGLVALCDEESLKKHLALKHCSPYAHSGKVQPGWVKVSMDALKTAKQLSRWVESSYTYALTLKASAEKPAAKKAAKPAAKPASKKAAKPAGKKAAKPAKKLAKAAAKR